MEETKGKVVIITGASNGIGAACARRFALGGARVAIADVDTVNGEVLAKEINASASGARISSYPLVDKILSGDGCELECTRSIFVKCDVRREEDIRNAFSVCEKTFGGIDVLVNNAGIQNVKKLMDTSLEEWNDVIQVNLTSVFMAMKLVVPCMKRRKGGVIVNISSSFAIVGSPGYAAYHASKGGVSSLTRAAAIDLLKDNIRVNAVCPGTTYTPGLVKSTERRDGPVEDVARHSSALMQSFLQKQPLGRFGEAEEIANVVFFLASDESSFMVGANVVVDGGYTIV